MRKSTPYLLLVPALLFTFFVLVYPLAQNLINSISNVSMITGRSGWAGLNNFKEVFEDTLFWHSFRNTVVYAVVGSLLALVLGLAFALLLNLRLGKLSAVMTCLYTIPWVISPVVAGFAWKWLLNDNFGIVNYWLANLGLAKIGTSWLGDPATALPCVMMARVWQFYPFAMVMFLAGIQSIPQEQYEAAAVDGATMVKRFFYITLPNLKAVTSVLLVLGVIWSFNDFNMIFIMTRGGPLNSSMVLSVLVREFSFVHFDLGKGSALSVVVFAMLTTLSYLYLKIAGKTEGA
jgi:multiple sugar transport system permease protein